MATVADVKLTKQELARRAIPRPVSDDGLVGYDSYNQFTVAWFKEYTDGDYYLVSTPCVSDVRDMTCVFCDKGWEMTSTSVKDQTKWQISDTIVHESCLVRHAGMRLMSSVFHALVAANVRFRGLTTIENGYWPKTDPWSKEPWFKAELVDSPARFEIGNRKRVISIELIAEGGIPFDLGNVNLLEKELAKEDVTKEFRTTIILIHAYGEQKMKEYVAQICKTMCLDVKSK